MDLKFLYNRYLRNRRIVKGYKYQFEPFGGPVNDEPYFTKTILAPGNLFLDIGANVGGWSIPASSFYKRVIAFEPNPRIVPVLYKNIRLNKLENVSVMPFALGEAPTDKILWQYPKVGQDSFLREHMGISDVGVGTKITVVALDSYGYEPSVIKIDTEGYELNVLKGASKTIQQFRPRLAIETHDPRDAILIEHMFELYRFERFIRPTGAMMSDQISLVGEAR